MAFDNVGAVHSTGPSSGTNGSAAVDSQSVASQRNIDDVSSSLTQSLTGGGRGEFSSPGAQQDFKNGVHDAVSDMLKGAEDARKDGKSPTSNSQFQRGIQELLSALQGLQGQQGAQGDQQSGHQQDPEGAGAAGGSGAPSGSDDSGGGDDEIKKLIAMLKKMGMGDKDIAALLGKLGVPSQQANQMVASAGQDGGADGSSGDGGSSTAAMGSAQSLTG